jgi:hypothetical protein
MANNVASIACGDSSLNSISTAKHNNTASVINAKP